MIILGKSRVVAMTVAVALASSTTLTLAEPAWAQGTPPATEAPKAPAKDAPAKDAKPAQPPPVKPAAPAKAAAAAKPNAKALFASGEKKFKADDFAGALADFQEAEAAKADPATERYIALSHDKLGQFVEAVGEYEKFIEANPPKMKDQVEEAKKRVEEIRAMPGKVKVETTPPGASVVIDTAETPYERVTPVEIELPPGKHTLLIGAEGYENTTKDVEVSFASKQEVNAELVKKASPPPPPPPVVAETPAPPPPAPPPPPEPRSKVPAFVTGAVAIVAAGVGTGFGIKALGQSSDFEDKPTTKKADDGENNALVADMMFGVAITFGVTSAVLFLSGDAPATASAGKAQVAKAPAAKKKSDGVKLVPAPYVTPHGGGIGTLVKF